MWMVNPSYMCRKHLLGEHVEIHMAVGSLLKERSIQGHLDKEQLFPLFIWKRHDQLVEEMEKRGYKHNSDLPPMFDVSKYENYFPTLGTVKRNMEDLFDRCDECAKRFTGRFEHNT